MFSKLKKLVALQGELLRDHQCGHPEWYAENLVALALEGQVMPTNFKAYDIKADIYGRVQVKCRVDGTDGSYNQNRTNFGKYGDDAFDWAAVVLFDRSFRVDGAKLLKLAEIRPLIRAHGHVKWQDVRNHSEAVDLTAQLVAASGET